MKILIKDTNADRDHYYLRDDDNITYSYFLYKNYTVLMSTTLQEFSLKINHHLPMNVENPQSTVDRFMKLMLLK